MTASKKQSKSDTNEIIEVDEIPLSIKKGTTITFGKINSTQYTHGIYSYPAKFIPQIASWGINYAGMTKGQKILDPFCGSGTSLLEARIRGMDSFGIDMNPLGRLVSKVKCTPLFQDYSESLWNCNEKLLEKITSDKEKIILEDQEDVNLHENWRFWFEDQIMKDLIKIKRQIRSFEVDVDDEVVNNLKDFYLVVLAATIKRVSFQDEQQIKVKKDQNKVKKAVPKPLDVFT